MNTDKITLHGLEKEKVMSPFEMKHVKGGSYGACFVLWFIDYYGDHIYRCEYASNSNDCYMLGGQFYPGVSC